MTTNFEAIITVLDRASAPMRAIQAKMEGIGIPLKGLNTRIASLGEALGFKKIAEGAEGAEKNIGRLHESLGALAGPLQALAGIGTIGGLVELTKKSAEFGAGLYDASIKTGVNVTQLARWHYAAQLAGTDSATLDLGLEKLNRTLAEAATGQNKEASAMFQGLGLAVRDAAGHVRSAADIAPEFVERISRMGDVAMKTKALTIAMGRGGGELAGFFGMGPDKLNELGDAFDKFHGGVTPQMTADGKKLEDSFSNLALAADGLRDAIGAALGPVLTPVLQKMSDWIAANRSLAASISTAGLALGGIGLAMSGPVRGAVVGLVKPFLDMGGAAFKGFALATRAVMGFVEGIQLGFTVFESLSLLFAANPIGVAIIAIGALAGAAFLIWKYWEPIKGFFVDLWQDVAGVFSTAWTWINKAFEKGWLDFVPIIGPFLYLARTIRDNWGSITSWFSNLWDGVGAIFTRAAQKLAAITAPFRKLASWLFGGAAGAIGGDGADGAPGGALNGPVGGAPSPLTSPIIARHAALAGKPGAAGKVTVDVNLKGAPPGSSARAVTSGNIDTPSLNVGFAWAPGL